MSKFPPMKNPRYYVKCENCTFGKDLGHAGFLADREARKHQHRHPAHTVWVFESVAVHRDTTPELGDTPPF